MACLLPLFRTHSGVPLKKNPIAADLEQFRVAMTEQWSDRSAMLNHKTLPPSGPLSYLHGSELKTWTSYWKREGSAGMDMWNAPTVQSRQPLTYRLMESVGLGGPWWLGSSWQRGIAERGSCQLSTLMIETPGDLVWDLPCVQQASCLEGGPLLWIWPLYLHVNQKFDDDDDDEGDFLYFYLENGILCVLIRIASMRRF